MRTKRAVGKTSFHYFILKISRVRLNHMCVFNQAHRRRAAIRNGKISSWRSKSFSRCHSVCVCVCVCASHCDTRRAFLHSPSLHLWFLHAAHVRPPREAINRIKRPWPQLPARSSEARLEKPKTRRRGVKWPQLCLGTTLPNADCVCVSWGKKNQKKPSEHTAVLPPERFFPQRPAPRCVFVSRWVTLLNSPTLLTDILFDRMLLDCSDAELLREVRKQQQHHRNWCPPAVYRMFLSHRCTAGLKTGVWKGVRTPQLCWTCSSSWINNTSRLLQLQWFSQSDPLSWTANQIYLTNRLYHWLYPTKSPEYMFQLNKRSNLCLFRLNFSLCADALVNFTRFGFDNITVCFCHDWIRC